MIVLLSGWAGVRTGMLPLALALRRRTERKVVRADLGLGLGCIRDSAQRAAELIARLTRDACDTRVDLVAHSMGGLVAAHLLKHIDRGRVIRSVVTLGTPHRGSPAAQLARGLTRGPLRGLAASLQQMVPGCEFLEELARADVPERSRLVSIAGLDDALVPALYAELPDAPRQYNANLARVGHLGLLLSAPVVDEVEKWLCPRVAPLRTVCYSPGGSGIFTRKLSIHS
jgi:pimeloyl-ACP methyl ester carboxylesterase